MQGDKIATQREQFDRYKREMEKVAAEKKGRIQQLKDELAAKNACVVTAKDAELTLKNHLVRMKDAELLQFRSQLNEIMVGRQQIIQLVDKLNGDVARAKANEDSISAAMS